MSYRKISLNTNSVAYGASILMGSSIVLNLLGVIYRLILARDLGSQGLALYQLTISIYTILSGIAISGFTSSVSQGACILKGSGHSKDIPSLLRHCVFYFFAIYSILLVVVLPLSPFLAETFLGGKSRATLIALLFPYMLLTGVENIHKSLFLGLGKSLLPSISEIVEQTIRILLFPQIIWVAHAYSPDAKATCLLVTMFLGEIFASSFMLLSFARHKGEITTEKALATAPCATIPKLILSIGIPTATAGLGIRIISSACSIFMPQCLMWSGLSQQEANHIFGTFTGMTMPLMTMCTTVTLPLFTAVMPKISQAMAAGNMAVCRRKCGKFLHISSIVVLSCMAILLICPKEISTLLYGVPYPGALCPMFVPCITLSLFAGATTFMLSSMGFNGISGVLAISSGILQLLNLWLGPVFLGKGLLGYAILETLNDLTILSIGLRLVCKKSGLKIMWHNWFIKPILALLPALLMAYGAYYYLRSYSLWLQVIATCILLFGTYFFLLICVWKVNIRQYLFSLLDKKTPEVSRV